jgi:hypothetical protein
VITLERLHAHSLGDHTGHAYPGVCKCVQHVACVYLSEEVLPLPVSLRLYSEAESSQIDREKQSALSKGARKDD